MANLTVYCYANNYFMSVHKRPNIKSLSVLLLFVMYMSVYILYKDVVFQSIFLKIYVYLFKVEEQNKKNSLS